MENIIDDRILNLPYARELVELRSNISSRDNVGVYSIFSNKQLEELCIKQPKSISELSEIVGFPEDGSRVRRWGKEVISVFSVKTNTNSRAFG